MNILSIISSTDGLRRQPIQFICPNCKQYVAELVTEAQMMVHFIDRACHFCDRLLTQADMVSQVQTYAMQHFDLVFRPDK